MNDWTWDNGDPDNIMFSLFAAPRAVTRLGFQTPDAVKAITDAQTEKDPQKRTELYLQAQKAILDESVNVILGYPNRIIGASAKVQNLILSPIGSIVLRDVDLS